MFFKFIPKYSNFLKFTSEYSVFLEYSNFFKFILKCSSHDQKVQKNFGSVELSVEISYTSTIR